MNYWIEWYQGLDYFSVEINVIKLIEMGTTALQLFVQWKHIKVTATLYFDLGFEVLIRCSLKQGSNTLET